MLRRSRPKILIEVIRAAGGLEKLGQPLGISAQAVAKWRRVPADRVVDVERITGIPREQLRPDLYGAPRPRPSVPVAA